MTPDPDIAARFDFALALIREAGDHARGFLSDRASLEMQTLVVSGGHSPLPTRRICFHLARMIPDVTARTVADAGHMLPVTHASKILPLIANHCGARRGRRADRDRELLERVSA